MQDLKLPQLGEFLLLVDTSEVTLGDWGRGGSHEGLGSFSKAIETYNVYGFFYRAIFQSQIFQLKSFRTELFYRWKFKKVMYQIKFFGLFNSLL